jgi:membrane protein required for colicin V production
MNWLDIVLLMVIAGSVVSSVRKGLTREIIGLAGVLLALVLGTWFYGMAGAVLEPYTSSRWVANFGGFVLVFGGVMLLAGLVGILAGKMLKVSGLSLMDRVLGAGFGLVRGGLIAVALVMAMMAFTPGVQPPASVVNSRVAPYVVDAARVCAAIAPHELKEGFRKTYSQVQESWSDAMKKGIHGTRDGRKAQGNERQI